MLAYQASISALIVAIGAELFTPLMAFFRDQEPQPGKVTLGILESSALPEVHCALYRVLCEAMKAEI